MNKKTLRIAGWALGLSMAVAGIGVAVGASQWASEPVMVKADSTTFTFSDIASANNWVNGSSYTTITQTPITITANGGGNNGKWYTSGNGSWRMYSGGTVVVSAADGYSIDSVTSTPSCTFTVNNGVASFSPSARTDFTSIVVNYSSDVAFGDLATIEVSNSSAHETVFSVGDVFSTEGLVLTATDTNSNTKAVNSGFTTDFDGVTFENEHIGEQTVTVTYEGKTTTYDIEVLPAPVYSAEFKDWTWSNKGTAIADRLLGEEASKWRMSVGEYYSSTYLIGDYNTDSSVWTTFASNKYYSSIASQMTTNTYGVAMYSQNFSVNKPNLISFEWGATSGIGATSAAYLLASTNGGYSWSVLQSISNISTNKTITWSGNTYASTNNVIIGFGFTSSSKNPQLKEVAIEIYGQDLANTANWATREITVSGNSEVEAEQAVTLTGNVVTSGYETPANTNLTWSSSDESIATVSSSGVVTGVATGEVTITASAADGNGASASKTITVTPKLKRVGSITLNTDAVQKSFVRNSQFNYNNLVVTANYSNGFDSEVVVPTSVTTPDMTTAGNQKTVTVTYEINGTSASATYKIDVTPIVATEVTLSCGGITLVDGRYKLTAKPNDLIEVNVTHNGDETTFTTSNSNNSIYYEDGFVAIESLNNDSGTIEFIVNESAKAYLDVTVNANETVTIVSPAGGEISGIVNQSIDFELSLINATEGEWSVSTNAAYNAVVVGDKNGCTGSVTLLDVCNELTMTVSVTTAKKIIETEFVLTAVADSITGISVKTNPTKTTYVVGDSFSAAGLVVSASRASGVARDLDSSEYTIKNAPTVLNERGAKEITIELNSDNTKKASFNITVNKPSGLKIVTKTSNDDGGYVGALVTNVSQLSVGAKVIIASATTDHALSTTQNTNNRGQADITKNGNSSSWDSDEVQIMTLKAGSKDGTFAFYTGSGYLYAASSGSNHLKTQQDIDDNASFAITIGDGAATSIVAQGTNSRNVVQYNSGSSIFACYGSASQKAVQLYTVEQVEPSYDYAAIDVTDGIYDFVRAVYNNSDYYTCDPNGVESVLTNWNNVKNANEFKALTAAEKDILAKAVLESEDKTLSTSKMFADYISQYDYVVGKYGVELDYLNRVSAGTLMLNAEPASNRTNTFNTGENSSLLIMVTASAGLLAAGGLLITRKRREEE